MLLNARVESTEATADYNPIATFYQEHWSSHYHPWAKAMLEKTLLTRVPKGGRILDLCCGNGIIAQHLSGLGYHVTGIDHSENMLRYARENSPESDFILADARSFRLDSMYDGALSTFDSLNHILSSEDLLNVFENVNGSLVAGAVFVFDAVMEEGYLTAWKNTCANVGENYACFIRGDYDENTRLGRTDITLFQENGSWHRSDVSFLQRFHPVDDITRLLRGARFSKVGVYNAIDDLGIEGYFGEGRAVFVAEK
jgi:SAM-dependent methyltransferase